ncbi:hypothetical protein HanIR_Chr03g0136601 [Helianthus annuus]|nr:hypothetical protein HanIR_Chr03g0136601 [Helianthus annuus]
MKTQIAVPIPNRYHTDRLYTMFGTHFSINSVSESGSVPISSLDHKTCSI